MPGSQPTPTATPLASGVQQSSATISAGLANVRLVASDGVTPLLYRQVDNALAVAFAGVDANVLPGAIRNAYASASPASALNGRGVVLALTISAAPNTSETLKLRWYPSVNLHGNVVAAASAAFAASITTSLGTSMQSGGPWTFFLWLYPGGVASFDNATFHASYSIAAPRLWTVDIVPSGASNWTYSLDYGALN